MFREHRPYRGLKRYASAGQSQTVGRGRRFSARLARASGGMDLRAFREDGFGIKRNILCMARYSQQLLQLFDLPAGLVVDDIGQAAPDRFVKLHHGVGNRSRDTFIFPRSTHQVVVFVVEGREYVVTIFVGFNAATVEVKCLSHLAPGSQAADRHVMERSFAFHIKGDPSEVSDCPRANSAIDFCHSVICIVCVVFRAASLRKLRSCCWSRAKREYDSHRSEHRFHSGTPFLTRVELAILGHRYPLKGYLYAPAPTRLP